MTTMASGSVSSKRRRPSTDKVALYSLSDLPSGILAHTASFLAAPSSPSRALLAIAQDENSAVTPNERSSAIIGDNWDVLDFGGIEKDVAARLSDADIEKVLLCVDAVNNVKRLKLTNCVAITGTCLEPLRGSLIIEQIDLSLIGEHQHPDLYLEPPISCDHVLPILDSIIEREGCALMHLHFPSMWRKERSTESAFHAFIVRYKEMLRSRVGIGCFECNKFLPVPDPVSREWINVRYGRYDTHRYTCYGCLKHYCYECNIDGEKKNMLHVCGLCGRDYCEGCSTLTYCPDCGEEICNDCYKNRCVKCNGEVCPKCVQDRYETVMKCEYCDKCYCQYCYGDEEEVDIIYTCSVKCCGDCRLRRYRQPLHCAEGMESLERKQLQNENKQLKVEMEELKREIRELKLENEELKLENKELRSGDIE